jgi:hypothetical protein
MSERKPCEICGDSDCEDAAIQYYIDKWQEAEALLRYREAEIVRLQDGFACILHEVKAGATDVEVIAICREMLNIKEEE